LSPLKAWRVVRREAGLLLAALQRKTLDELSGLLAQMADEFRALCAKNLRLSTLSIFAQLRQLEA